MMKQLAAITVFIVGCGNNNHAPNGTDGGAGAGGDGGSIDAAIDAPGGCTDNGACSGTTPICNLASMTCVGCQMDSDCAGVGSAHTCLPSGACAGDGDVAYVTSTGSDQGPTCSFAAPCQTVGYALENTTAATIVLTGHGSDAGVTIDRDVALLGRGSASLGRTGTTGPVVTIGTTANVSIYDVTIANAPGTDVGDGLDGSTSGNVSLQNVTIIHSDRYGIDWTGTGSLTLTQSTVETSLDDGIAWAGSGMLTLMQSTITSNTGIGIDVGSAAGAIDIERTLIGSNAGGGLQLVGTGFHIENTLIVNNGAPMAASTPSNFGGVYVQASPNTTDAIIFSTIASNQAKDEVAGAVTCVDQVNALTFSDDILGSNAENGALQTDGTGCAYTYTDFFPAETFRTGTGNGSGDPGLTADFHLDGTGSAVVDTANATGAPDIDYFGTVRPQGSGYDMGAAEYQP